MAQGKARAGLVQLDSAAVELGTEEMQLQRAEWRLIPPALGLHGWPSEAPDSLRRWLERHAGDSVLGPRVRWTVALGRLAAGDTSGFVHHVDALPAGGEPLGALLQAIRAGLRPGSREEGPLADSLRQAVHLTRPPDPFAPAVLHLLEGERAARSHDADAADRAWRWYLAAEFEGWPSGSPQAGEVDGVIGMLARRRRAELRLATGTGAADTAAACVMLRRVAELWEGADSGLAWMATVPGAALTCQP